MLLSVIGLSAITVSRIEHRRTEGANDRVAASLYAQSAIELGFVMIYQDPAWRTSLGTGSWLDGLAIGRCTLGLTVATTEDGDGQPDNNPAVLTGTGVCGAAEHRIQVIIVPERGGMVASPGSWTQVVN